MREFWQKNSFIVLFVFSVCILVGLLANSWDRPLQGIHGHRQADTLFTAYNYCLEGGQFLRPHVIHSGDGAGISIGELPLFSYILSWPCRVTGVWSETAAKWVTWIIFIFAGMVWTTWILQQPRVRQWKEKNQVQPFEVFAIYLFTSIFLVHLSIPIPDGLALLLIGLAGLSSRLEKRGLGAILSVGFFALGFWIRPYLIFLLPLIEPNWRRWFWSVAVCGVVYFFWYKWWAPHESTFMYYNISILSPAEMMNQFPKALLSAIKQIIFEHTNIIGVYLLWKGVRAEKSWRLYWLGALLGVLLLRGMHIFHHNYYLLASATMAWCLLVLGYVTQTRSRRWKIFAGFLVIGLIHNQHLWHRPKTDPWPLIQKQVRELSIGEKSLIAVYGDSPTDLYYAKRHGFLLGEPNKGGEGCPTSAEFYMFYEGNLPRISKCR